MTATTTLVFSGTKNGSIADNATVVGSISGATALDSSGLGNNGTISGATKTMGKRGQALDFDGSDDYVNVGSPDNLDNLSSLSISVWAKADGYGQLGQGYLISKVNSAFSGWHFKNLVTNSTVNFTATYDGGTNLVVSGATNTLTSNDFGKWIHWTVTWDGSSSSSSVHIYKNGTEIYYLGSNTSGVGNRKADAAYNMVIGNYDYSGHNRTFDGSIDEVRVYNRVLSPEEIGDLYRMGSVKISK